MQIFPLIILLLGFGGFFQFAVDMVHFSFRLTTSFQMALKVSVKTCPCQKIGDEPHPAPWRGESCPLLASSEVLGRGCAWGGVMETHC